LQRDLRNPFGKDESENMKGKHPAKHLALFPQGNPERKVRLD
jgi:hypothetical protein